MSELMTEGISLDLLPGESITHVLNFFPEPGSCIEIDSWSETEAWRETLFYEGVPESIQDREFTYFFYDGSRTITITNNPGNIYYGYYYVRYSYGKQPEFLVKGYHYTKPIFDEDENLITDSCKLFLDPNAESCDIVNGKLIVNTNNSTIKQNGSIEFITEQMTMNNYITDWSFNLPETQKDNSLIHIRRYKMHSTYDEIIAANLINYFYNQEWKDFEFVHDSSKQEMSSFIFNSSLNNKIARIQYKTAETRDSRPTITYENINNFIWQPKGITQFCFNKDTHGYPIERKKKKSLWFSPHQDDEVLTLGYGIINDILNGYDVHVILCTDGGGTGVLRKWRNGTTCNLCQTIHYGYVGTNFTREEFSKYRDFEFVNCCLHLGVKSENIHIFGVNNEIDLEDLNFVNEERDIIKYNWNSESDKYYRLKDGGLGAGYKEEVNGVLTDISVPRADGIDNAKVIIRAYIDKIADDGETVAIRTIHPIEDSDTNLVQHKDHNGLGTAAIEIANENNSRVSEIKTFVEPYVYNKLINDSDTNNILKSNFDILYNSKYIEKLHWARYSYMHIDWDNGYHGVGYHSVQSYLNSSEKDNIYYLYRG